MNVTEAICTTYKGVHDQGGYGLGDQGCEYRTDSGNRCAVGCALTPELIDLIYKMGHGCDGVNEIFEIPEVEDHLAIDGLSKHENINFWSQLQRIHDTAATRSHYEGDKWKAFDDGMEYFASLKKVELAKCA